MSTTQAYGTYMFIGALIFVGYVFVSTGNFVEPHRIRVEELDSVEIPKGNKVFKLTKDKSSIHAGDIKEKAQPPKASLDVGDHSRQRRSPQQLNKMKEEDVKSMDQKDDQNAVSLEEKRKNIQSSADEGIKQPKPVRKLESSEYYISSKIDEPLKLVVKTRDELKRNKMVDDNVKVKPNEGEPVWLTPRKRNKHTYRKKKTTKKKTTKKKKKTKRIRVVKVQKEQKLTAEEKNILEQKLINSFGENYNASSSYKRIVDKCSEYHTHKGRILFFDPSKYILSQPHLCDGDIHVLLAVHTRPKNFERRELIRNTFGSMRYIKGKRIALAFFVGASKDKNINERIQKEAESHRDVVQRDYIEHYRNMTYKHLTVMDWLMEFCPKAGYLVKVDDDVFANIFQVVDYIDTFSPQTFYCTRTFGPKPQRHSGKWKLTYDEYPKTKFPPYCMGYAYLMKASLAKDMYWCSIYSKFLWIDDVLVGGILPQKLGVDLVKFISGHDSTYLLPSHGSWKIADHMFLLGTRNELLPDVIRKIWRASLQYSY